MKQSARGPISIYLLAKKPPTRSYLSGPATETRHEICPREGTHPWGQTSGIAIDDRIRDALQHAAVFLP